MYQPYTAWLSNDARALEFSWMSMAHPIDPRGILLSSNGPDIAAYANTVGIALDFRSRFRVSSDWVRRRYH